MMRSSSSKPFRVVVAVVLGALLTRSFPVLPAHADPSAADMESAKALIKEGRELRDKKGDLPTAIARFSAAHALANTPITAMELATTLVKAGQLVEARRVALEVERIPVGKNESATAKKARTDAAALATSLKERTPTLQITLEGPIDKASPAVSIDGTEVPLAALAVPRALDPGTHKVALTQKGADAQLLDVTLAEKEAKTITLTVKEPPPPPPPEPVAVPVPSASVAPAPVEPPPPAPVAPVLAPEPPPPAPPAATHSSAQSTWGGILTFTGIVGLGVGGYFGYAARARWHDADSECTGNDCSPGGASIRADARNTGDVATYIGIGAGVLTAVGLIVWISAPSATPSDEKIKPAPTTTSLRVQPTGLSFEVKF
ncbi:MAG: hypothetical protein ACHREM_18075 [Polyangiales bacterium]